MGSEVDYRKEINQKATRIGELERSLDTTSANYERSLDKIADLEAKLAEAQADTEMLDWLESECNKSALVAVGKLRELSRAAIDEAKGESK